MGAVGSRDSDHSNYVTTQTVLMKFSKKNFIKMVWNNVWAVGCASLANYKSLLSSSMPFRQTADSCIVQATPSTMSAMSLYQWWT